jgi:hypothetical protein
VKAAPPPPGWIERLFRSGVGLAIPLTIIAGLVLLLSAHDEQSRAAPPPGASHTVVSVPLEDARPSVTLKVAPKADCGRNATAAGACPRAATDAGVAPAH